MSTSAVTATDAKNQFGRVLDRVARGQIVTITKHDAPTAVVMSFDDYTELTERAGKTLDTLSAEFDAVADRMQTPKHKTGMRAAFDASPVALGKAAVAAARRRG